MTAQPTKSDTFWATFRIEKRGFHDERRKALYEALEDATNGPCWKDPTSFVLFTSDWTIDAIAALVKTVIDPKMDVVLIGKTEWQDFRLVGYTANQADLRALLPALK